VGEPDTAANGKRPVRHRQGKRGADAPYTTLKSHDEESAATGSDLLPLADDEAGFRATVETQNPGHEGWRLVIPCTNPANNKTFDHRQLDLATLSADAVRSTLPPRPPPAPHEWPDGWAEPAVGSRAGGAARFVLAAARLLTEHDWALLSAAAGSEMNSSPAAFDVASGVYWGMRNRGVGGLPSRRAMWLVLKLMATVPARARVVRDGASFSPLHQLPRRQIGQRVGDRSARSRYPLSFPVGRRLEADLHQIIDKRVRQQIPEAIDWAGLCHGLDQLLH
jgi:hypothetical protein